MKKLFLILFLILLVASGCVSSTEFERLDADFKALKFELSNFKSATKLELALKDAEKAEANVKISDMPELTSGNLADGDIYPMLDISEALAADKNKHTIWSTMNDAVTGQAEAVGSGWSGDSTVPPKSSLHTYFILSDADLNGTPDYLEKDIQTSAVTPSTLTIVQADGSTWDPVGLGISKDYDTLYTTGGHKALWDEDGNLYISGIETPTLQLSELDDTSTPHTLVVSELKNKIISNDEATGANELDAPALAEGWMFILVKEADQNFTIDPNGTENWYFRTDNGAYTQNGAGTSITNTTAGKSSMTCFSTEDDVYCTGDANWEQGS